MQHAIGYGIDLWESTFKGRVYFIELMYSGVTFCGGYGLVMYNIQPHYSIQQRKPLLEC
jgi:hypothetical protein